MFERKGQEYEKNMAYSKAIDMVMLIKITKR